MKKVRVLFVCLGNICRSPTAEGVFAQKVAEAGLCDRIEIDSAGTSGWHIDKAPDSRTAHAAANRGYDLSSLRSRKAVAEDFDRFDYILAMDEDNYQDLKSIAPKGHQASLSLFLEFAESSGYSEVPDPYYGGEDGFELVLDLVEEASNGLLNTITKSLAQR